MGIEDGGIVEIAVEGIGVLEDVAAIRARSVELGRAVEVNAAVNIVCRPTNREAEEYYRYYADEQADWAAIDRKSGVAAKHGFQSEQYATFHADRVRQAAGYGSFPVVGDPDTVAGLLAQISGLGFTALAIGLVNYLDEFPFLRDEVLPRLERLGVRERMG